MSDPFLSNVDQADSQGVKFAKIQRWLKQSCINAGASIASSDPLLSDVHTGDSEGMKFAKIQRWIKLLSNSVGAPYPYTPENAANKGQPNGYAALDGNAKVPVAEMPNIQDLTTTAAPAVDDWLVVGGATNGWRKLAPSYFTTGGATYKIWGYVATYADLPLGTSVTDPNVGDIVGVNTDTGVSWFGIGNKRYKGYYKRSALTGVVATDYGTAPFASFSEQADQATVDAGTSDTQYVSPLTFANASKWTGYLKNNVGISGGTTLVGGTAASENLTLSTTSNATKGQIRFGTSVYDEVNNRLGLQNNAPASIIDIGAITDGSKVITINGTNSAFDSITFTTGTASETFKLGRRSSQGNFGIFDGSSNAYFTISNSAIRLGNVGLQGVTAADYTIAIGGKADRTIGVVRNTNADTVGKALTINAGGATSGGTNRAGGTLSYYSGQGTGNSTGIAHQWWSYDATVSGTDDQTATAKMTMLNNGFVGIGNTNPQYKFHVSAPSNAYIPTAYIENTDDPVAGSTRLTIRNPATELTINAYGSSAAGALANSVGLFCTTSNRDLMLGTWTGTGSIKFITNTDYANPKMLINSSGFVGVGSLTPVGALTLTDSSGSTTPPTTRGLWITQHSTGIHAPLFTTRKSRGTEASPTACANGDYIGLFDWTAYVGSSGYVQGARILSLINGTVTNTPNGLPAELAFYTNDGTNGILERLRINKTGLVGIGVTAPAFALDVAGNGGSATLNNTVYSDTATDAAGFTGRKARGTQASPTAAQADNILSGMYGAGYSSAGSFGSNTGRIAIHAAENFTGTNQGTYITLSTTPKTTITRAEVVRIDDAGKVGIGTTAPTSKLHVAGAVTLGYVEKTANYTLDGTDYTVNCTANTFTATLPTAVGIAGRVYNIKNTGSGVITIATTSSQTIDGATTQTLSASSYANIQVQSTGANWIIL